MIHIVFNELDIAALQQVFELDETLNGDIVHIKDDYAVGRLSITNDIEGQQFRYAWWQPLIDLSPYTILENDVEDFKSLNELKEKLDNKEQEIAWIWMGQNQHDVCGYYWAIAQLMPYAGRIHIIYLNNLPFINEKGQLFYPSYISQIRPTEILKAKKLVRPVSLYELELDPEEWKKLCDENAMVRSLEGGKKIVSRDETFFDSDILTNLPAEWQPASRFMSSLLGKMKIKTGDVFLMWRISELVLQGKIAITGQVNKDWKSFDIKKPGTVQQSIPLPQQDGEGNV